MLLAAPRWYNLPGALFPSDTRVICPATAWQVKQKHFFAEGLAPSTAKELWCFLIGVRSIIACFSWKMKKERSLFCLSFSPLTSSLRAAADYQVQKGALLGFCLSGGFEGLIHGSSRGPEQWLIPAQAVALVNNPKVHILALQTG